MKILKFLLIAIGGIIVLILLVALFVPKTYELERSVVIHAPQVVVMDQVKSLKKMHEWSPWTEMDPKMEVSYSGTDGEVGSSTSWKSDKAGVGSQIITKLTPDTMESKLIFKKPMESVSTAFFHTQNEGTDVKATWGMKGQNSYPFNVMNLFMGAMMGKDYEKGLAKLKLRCEGMTPNQ